MKTTRREFLKLAGCAAIAAAAGAMTGVRVEDPPAPLPDLKYDVLDDFTQPNGTETTLHFPLGFGVSWRFLESKPEGAYEVAEDGHLVWHVPPRRADGSA